MATDSRKVDKIREQPIWKKFWLFRWWKNWFQQRKERFLENALCYVNQGCLSTVKNEALAIYNNNFIIGQLLVAANQPEKIDEYKCKKDEVKLVTFTYDKSTGYFNGLKFQLAYIGLRGGKEQVFFSFGVNENKSCYSLCCKRKIPNAFVSMCFKRHFREITEERQHGADHWSL